MTTAPATAADDAARLRSAAQRALESLDDLIADSVDPGVEALGARHELARELTRMNPAATRRSAEGECASRPIECETEEECADRLETERSHAAGDHQYCGLTCEIEFPGDMLRNAILHRAIPGSVRMLDELLRRASNEAEADIHAALDGQPAPPAQHAGGNAEGCPAREGANLTYPFICPGKSVCG
ncbi:hypothetical protein ABT282_08525 [Streptomyces sp. NPDC000927]|uniref:hypothetical protein n=1 Tax=Streptomyces sp. NPDC000927 TaxID=3154371 RepID=UPI00331822CE